MSKKPKRIKVWVTSGSVSELKRWGQLWIWSKKNGYKSRIPALLIIPPEKAAEAKANKRRGSAKRA